MGEFLGYLLDVIFLLATLRMVYGALRHLFVPRRPATENQGRAAAPADNMQGEMARDPVCGMFVSTEVSHRLKWGGETLHFCSAECLEKYKLAPSPASYSRPL
jgi:YHS domain-containing protein